MSKKRTPPTKMDAKRRARAERRSDVPKEKPIPAPMSAIDSTSRRALDKLS